MSDDLLFKEVEEDLRREKLKRFWDQFGVYILAACFVVIFGVAGYQGWGYWQTRQAEEAGRAYAAALDHAQAGRYDEAAAAFTELAGRSGGAGVLAELQLGSTLAEQGRREEALEIYDRVAQRRSYPALADLARIRAALLELDTAGLDQIQARVGSLDRDGNPWRNTAREVLALAAYRDGEWETADRLFSAILADPQASFGLRQRAQVMLSLIGPELGRPPGEVIEAVPEAMIEDGLPGEVGAGIAAE